MVLLCSLHRLQNIAAELLGSLRRATVVTFTRLLGDALLFLFTVEACLLLQVVDTLWNQHWSWLGGHATLSNV